MFILNLHALKINQVDTEVYVTIMKATELLRYAKIDFWSEENPQGYQRPLLERRIAKAVNYLFFEDKIFPTSVLVNVRGKVDFMPACMIEDFVEYGILRIPANSLPLWIVDGQHRVMAIAMAARENPQYRNYPIPVSLLTLRDRYSEMRMFYIINSRQKRIPTGLVQRHLRQTISKIGIEEVRKYEVKRKVMAALAIMIVDILRQDPSSPWHGKIFLPTEKKKIEHIISQTSFADSIGILLNDLSLRGFDLSEINKSSGELAQLLINYWNVLKEIFPEAFELPQDYTIQKTIGCYVLHKVFPYIYELCKKADDFSKGRMKTFLTEMFNNVSQYLGITINSEFWNRWTGHPLATGTGMKVVKQLATILIDSLPPY
jgi:DGQHR domain-containing protein